MIDEAKKTQAQYLNGWAVAVMSLAASAVLACAPWWFLAGGFVLSGALHSMAVRVVRCPHNRV